MRSKAAALITKNNPMASVSLMYACTATNLSAAKKIDMREIMFNPKIIKNNLLIFDLFKNLKLKIWE